MSGLHWWKILGVCAAVVTTPAARILAWWHGTPRHAYDPGQWDEETVAFYGSFDLDAERALHVDHELPPLPEWPPRRVVKPAVTALNGAPGNRDEAGRDAGASDHPGAADWLACRSLAYVQTTTAQACQ